MSEKYTEVETDSGGLGIWGHAAPAEAIAELREHYEHQAKQAASVLAEIESGRVRVFHQYGPWARDRRHCVYDGERVQ